ncbi:hypothetical protein L198_08201 [Cryptococcus wingfieldii CBS 7118]|uniref:Uncharacterized protein n=1 Tax=Cryptococcus wingfieldii CBS 7118 TaxID=1295528 RepID=A0A1E3HF10_9TREE|nr:hypothetical protein L198_08190 [Cryptococcus wingfieldii CBS 7118]XP_019027859.1 hypothetical protein L198_08201 [Cryptococcus wingfieldii CBS 7118]ODN74939.1 hypothetical protein L198_08190 [Cryptococcus wingfieldii CBS 7118]ODN74950.1 hypothetical protein L198_08201 [Cryptococcus wingfieldii CBS 7118]
MSNSEQDYSVHIPDDSCVARTHFVISAKPYEELGYDDEPVTLWQSQLSHYKYDASAPFADISRRFGSRVKNTLANFKRRPESWSVLNSESRQESLNNIEELVNACAAQAVYKEGIVVWDVERDEGSGEQESDDSSSSPADDDREEEGSDATD